MKKTMAVVALAGSLTFLGAGAANAAPPSYPSDEVTVTVPTGTVESGESVPVSGSGYTPFEKVTIKVFRGDRLVETLEVDADGDGNFYAAVPLGYRDGTYTITAMGGQSGLTSSVQVSVVSDDEDDDNGSDDDDDWDNDGSDDDNGNGSDGEGNGDDNGSDHEGNGSDDEGNGAGNGTGGGNNAAGPDALANTGLDSGALMLGGAGVLLLGAGATAVVISRRKNA